MMTSQLLDTTKWQIQTHLFKSKFCWRWFSGWGSILNFLHYWHLQINNKIFLPSSLDALNGLPEKISDESIKLFDNFFYNLEFVFEPASIVMLYKHDLISKNHSFQKINQPIVAPWCSGYHYCTTSFNKV